MCVCGEVQESLNNSLNYGQNCVSLETAKYIFTRQIHTCRSDLGSDCGTPDFIGVITTIVLTVTQLRAVDTELRILAEVVASRGVCGHIVRQGACREMTHVRY
jgi:hypothetical protein